MGSYDTFLESLLSEGQVTVPEPAPLSAQEMRAGDAYLLSFAERYRLEMPGEAPNFVTAAGRWAGIKFYRACQYTIFRDIDAETIAAELTTDYSHPANATADVHFSTDIVFRFLPDLMRFAHRIAEQDPLLKHFMDWGRAWPLSSVGVPNLENIMLEEWINHPSLLQLYVDRIIARQDASRLKDARVRMAVEAAVGGYSHLAGSLTAQLTLPEGF